LKILSLGRNLIKSFAGLEPLGDTLEELWISYNCIEKMKGIQVMRNLRVLYMSNNLVREWNEFARLQELVNLRDLVFVGNPLYENLEVFIISNMFFNKYCKTKLVCFYLKFKKNLFFKYSKILYTKEIFVYSNIHNVNVFYVITSSNIFKNY